MSDIKAYVVHILRYCDVEKILNIGKTILCSVQNTKLWVTKNKQEKMVQIKKVLNLEQCLSKF